MPAMHGSLSSGDNVARAMGVPLFDIRFDEGDREAVDRVLRSGWLTMGPRTEEFEEQFAAHLGVRHAVAVSSGTAALHLAFLAAGIGPGDEVIVPAITFVATANAVRYCGGSPVLADVRGQHDFGIDVADVERRITSRTKAVCAVHYGGYAAPIEELVELCAERGIVLIEDAAHSPSATAPGSSRKLGGWGLAGAFSFFSNKVLSCGEGGLLATNDDSVAALARSCRSHAMTSGTWDRHRGHAQTYDVVGLGFNYRIDEIRSALLSRRLAGIEADIEKRRRLVGIYREELSRISGVGFPYSDTDVSRSSCYIMPITVNEPSVRDRLRSLMRDRFGVQTSVLYPSIANFSAYSDTQVGSLAHSDLAARTQVTLPLFPHMSGAQQQAVIDALRYGLEATRGEEGEASLSQSS
jgi:dTDP-4-amino-4,6-dideoxygalactose transaminase